MRYEYEGVCRPHGLATKIHIFPRKAVQTSDKTKTTLDLKLFVLKLPILKYVYCLFQRFT